MEVVAEVLPALREGHGPPDTRMDQQLAQRSGKHLIGVALKQRKSFPQMKRGLYPDDSAKCPCFRLKGKKIGVVKPLEAHFFRGLQARGQVKSRIFHIAIAQGYRFPLGHGQNLLQHLASEALARGTGGPIHEFLPLAERRPIIDQGSLPVIILAGINHFKMGEFGKFCLRERLPLGVYVSEAMKDPASPRIPE